MPSWVPVDRVDQAVLTALAGDVLRPAVVRAISSGVFEALQPQNVAMNIDILRAELRALDRKIENLTVAIEDGAATAPLVAKLQTRQTEREALLTAVIGAEAVAQLTRDHQAVEQQVLAQVEKWRALLTTNSVQDGRQLLREVLAGPLTFTPDRSTYRFEGDVTTGPMIAGLVGLPPKGTSPTALLPLPVVRGAVGRAA